jgi:hypothetical protein
MQTMEPDGSLGIEQCEREEVPNRVSGHTRAQEWRPPCHGIEPISRAACYFPLRSWKSERSDDST